MRIPTLLLCCVVLSASFGCGKASPNTSQSTSQTTVITGGTQSYASRDDRGSIEFKRLDDIVELKLTGDRGDHEIALKAKGEQSPDKPYRVYAISKIVPEQPLDLEHLMWFFRQTDTAVAIETDDGRLITHPDSEVIEELENKFIDPPDVAGIIEAFPKLIRTDSRTNLLLKAAGAPTLNARSIDSLIELVSAGSQSALFVADYEKFTPSYDASLLSAVISELAKREDLSAEHANRLAKSCPSLDFDYYESASLVSLCRKASIEDVLKSAAKVQDGQNQHTVLLELARREGLSEAEADKIAATTPSINFDYYEQVVLVQLASAASVPVLLQAAGEILTGENQHQVLAAMINRADLNRTMGDAIARATPKVNFDYYEAVVLKSLAGKASSKAILEGAAQIVEGQQHHDVMMAIIQLGDLKREDANHLAELCPSINFDYYEEKVLTALAPIASVKAIIKAASQIVEGQPHYNALAAIAHKEKLSAEEATLLVKACPEIDFDYYEAQLLKELSAIASVDAILTAANGIVDDGNALHDVLMALARRDLSSEDADRIALATANISFDSYKAEVLVALVGRASPATLKAAAKKISSDTDRVKVLDALNE